MDRLRETVSERERERERATISTAVDGGKAQAKRRGSGEAKHRISARRTGACPSETEYPVPHTFVGQKQQSRAVRERRVRSAGLGAERKGGAAEGRGGAWVRRRADHLWEAMKSAASSMSALCAAPSGPSGKMKLELRSRGCARKTVQFKAMTGDDRSHAHGGRGAVTMGRGINF